MGWDQPAHHRHKAEYQTAQERVTDIDMMEETKAKREKKKKHNTIIFVL